MKTNLIFYILLQTSRIKVFTTSLIRTVTALMFQFLIHLIKIVKTLVEKYSKYGKFTVDKIRTH